MKKGGCMPKRLCEYARVFRHLKRASHQAGDFFHGMHPFCRESESLRIYPSTFNIPFTVISSFPSDHCSIRMKRMVLIAVVFSAGLSYLSSRGAGAGAAESGLDLRGKRVVEAVDYEYEIPYPGESRSITAGGLSGLWYAGEEDGMGIFYTVSDRGPQSRRIGSVPGDKPEDTRRNERIFDDPDFPTTVYKLGWNGEDVKTLDSFSLLMPDGKGGFRPATGIGQLDDDDASWRPNSTDSEGFNDYSEIPRDAFGIDAEAILLLSLPGVNNGRPVFVISDEYRPMIAFFDAETHRLVKRLVPANTDYSGIEYERCRGG